MLSVCLNCRRGCEKTRGTHCGANARATWARSTPSRIRSSISTIGGKDTSLASRESTELIQSRASPQWHKYSYALSKCLCLSIHLSDAVYDMCGANSLTGSNRASRTRPARPVTSCAASSVMPGSDSPSLEASSSRGAYDPSVLSPDTDDRVRSPTPPSEMLAWWRPVEEVEEERTPWSCVARGEKSEATKCGRGASVPCVWLDDHCGVSVGAGGRCTAGVLTCLRCRTSAARVVSLTRAGA